MKVPKVTSSDACSREPRITCRDSWGSSSDDCDRVALDRRNTKVDITDKIERVFILIKRS